jgi:sulfonate transport system substrate-binding protein
MTHPYTRSRQRRRALGLLFAAALATPIASLSAQAADTLKEVRIGYQKYGTLTLLKGRGTLDKRLAEKNIAVKWTEFPAGPQLLEGLNVGSIDFGTVGEAPPIFAQAAGANLVYVGNEPPSPESEAIVVPKGSTLKSVTELKGKKVVLNKGSNVHYLLVKALEKAGVDYRSLQIVYLPPADARAAFERGAVDAWVIWDPFLAAAQAATGARTLVDGSGLVDNHQFYLASRDLAAREPGTIHAIIEELDAADRWAAGNQEEVARLFGPRVGIPAPVLQVALERMGYGVATVTDEVLDKQQRIADTFHELGLIPKSITVRDAAWRANA